MSRSDAIFGSAVLALLFAFAGTEQATTAGAWLFYPLLIFHVAAYTLLRRMRLRRDGMPLLGGIESPAPETRASLVMLAALLAAAFLLRLPNLGQGLWFDEIETLISYAREPLARILTTFHSRNQHMLYSLLAHASLVTFGESAWALRLPAMLLGVASLWAVYHLARLLTRQEEAVFAIALLTVSYHHVWFSQNARGYTALMLCTVVASTILVRLLAAVDNRVAAAWGYGAVMALGIFTHATAVFVVIAHALIWAACWWRARSRPAPSAVWLPLLGFVLAATLSLLLYARVLPQLVRAVVPKRALIMRSELAATKAPVAPRIEAPPTYIPDRAQGADRMLRRIRWFVKETANRLAIGVAGAWVTLAFAVIACLAGLWSYARQSPALLAVLVLPGIVALTLLFLMDQILFPRFFFFVLGFVVLIVVRGIYAAVQWLVGPRLRVVASSALAILCFASLFTVANAWAPKQNYEAARDFVRAHAAADDAVVVVSVASLAYLQYLREPWQIAYSGADLQRISAAHATTWVVYTMALELVARHPDMWRELQEGYTRAAVFPATVGDGEIYVAKSRAR